MVKPLKLPEPTICDMNCFFPPDHVGPHQNDPERWAWVKEYEYGMKTKLNNGTIVEDDGLGIKVYQCGPMAACTDEEMHGWRENLKKEYPNVTWLDPCDRSYKQQQWRRLVDDDIADIDAADYVLAYYWKTGTGSAMELSYNFYVAKKPSIVVVPGFKAVSPWLRYHADYLVDTFDHAMKIILNNSEEKF